MARRVDNEAVVINFESLTAAIPSVALDLGSKIVAMLAS
jgi:hypothetical protein